MTTYSPQLIARYQSVTTATLTTVLMKMGLRNTWIRGALPIGPGQDRAVGAAFTLRFIPAREDLSTMDALASPISTRTAIEAMPSGCIAVIDGCGCIDAGVLGDILCQRMQIKDVTAVVTDGTVRDRDGVIKTGLSMWANGVSAPPSIARLSFAGWQDPIGCGGVAIVPGDLIVADNDGAVVVPRAIVGDVIEIATEQEVLEEWILNEIKSGASLPGLYPPNDDNKKRFEAWQSGLTPEQSAEKE